MHSELEEASAWQIAERLARAAADRRSNLRSGRALWNLNTLEVVDKHTMAAHHVKELRMLSAAASNDLLNSLESKLLRAVEDKTIASACLPSLLRAVNNARLPLRDQSMLQQAWAEIQLTLAMDIRQIAGQEERAKHTIACDLARAVRGSSSHIHVERLRAGSIVASVYLMEGLTDNGRQPYDAAIDLERQLADPMSPLKRGDFTQSAVGLRCVGAGGGGGSSGDSVASALTTVGNLYIENALQAADEKTLAELEKEATNLRSLAKRWADAALALALQHGADSGNI